MTRSIACVPIQNFRLGFRESPDSSAKYKPTEDQLSRNRISSHLEGSVLGSAVKHLHKKYYPLPHAERFLNKSTQTDYRENECQTVPWDPPYRVPEGQNPEVLTIAHFAWGNGLPAGIHEIHIINRMRKKRAWEEMLPPADNPCNIQIRTAIVTELEAEEWAFREAEIQFLMNMRMELADQEARRKEDEKMRRLEYRFKRLDERLAKRKEKELESIRSKFSRELRKLSLKHWNVGCESRKRDIVNDFARRESDYKVNSQFDCSRTLLDNTCDEKITIEDSELAELPKWLLSTEKPRYTRDTSPSDEICLRKRKRDAKKLQELFEKGHSIRVNIDQPENCSLLKRKDKIPSLPATPRRSPENDDSLDDDVERSCNLLQRIVNGRAVQCEILEGRNRHRELIEELEVARALEEHSKDFNEVERKKLFEQERKILQEQRLAEIMEALEGKTVAVKLSFLTDELKRLQGEKKAHALALLAERELVNREIAQAGMEQLEINKREELDEIYRHVLKVNQESVETYLEDIVREGIEWLSESNARKYVVELADKTEAMTKRLAANANQMEIEGLVSDMLCNMVLPEVDREMSRERLHKKQMSHLRAAHESIYQEIFNIPDDDLLSNETLRSSRSSCPGDERTISESGRKDEIELDCKSYDERKIFHESIIRKILDYSEVTNGLQGRHPFNLKPPLFEIWDE